MIRAVLFDMDGVLADTEPLHFLAVQELLKGYGFVLPDSQFMDYVGISEGHIWELAKKEYGITMDFLHFENERRKHFFKIIEKSLFPTRGVLKLLGDLKKHSVRIALVTSSGREIAEAILNKLKIKDSFEVMVTADDVSMKKPHNEPYLLALKKLGIGPESCAAVEDSVHGIESAKSAGIYCIGVNTYGKAEIVSRADMAVNSLEEIKIENINNTLIIVSSITEKSSEPHD
jgi:HAD superfamily hydrolase (TIGR01509 family)